MLSPAVGSLVEDVAAAKPGKASLSLSPSAENDGMVKQEFSPTTQKEDSTEESTASTPPPDHELITEAEHHFKEDQLLAAARLLRKVRDNSLLQDKHIKVLRRAHDCQSFVDSLKSPVDDESEWTKQGENHGRHESVIYYKMEGETGTHLTARVETPIPSTLLVPLLSVLNESELYKTWLPSWERPVRLGVTKSEKLGQAGRVNQVLAVGTASPWPLAEREVIIGAWAFDDIDSCGDIAVRLKGLHTNSTETDVVIPPPEGRAVRADFDGGFLFRKCPEDHPALVIKQDTTLERTDNDGNTDGEQEHVLLASFLMYVDPKISFLPQSVINFVVRTVIGRMWEKFLSVAEDVKDGKRPRHRDAIEEKRECLYDWVDERVEAMFERLNGSSTSSTDDGTVEGGERVDDDVESSVENSREYLSYLQC